MQVDDSNPAYEVFSHAVLGGIFSEEVATQLLGPGMTVGQFRLLRTIAVGGMGEVYFAKDVRLERHVAVKIIQSRDTRETIKEARAIAQIEHPNVVKIFEVGDRDGRTFIAMEYIEGGTLQAWLHESARDWWSIVEKFVLAGRGLSAAHARGLTHADFKPSNVMVGEDGRVCVIDFGLAQAHGPSGPGGHDEDTHATVHDSETITDRRPERGIAGTLKYMPLEQLLGQTPLPTVDQFAFCTALYEALWGEPPFPGESLPARWDVLATSKPREPATHQSAPRSLWPIIRRGLAQQPADRWPGMPDLITALEAALNRSRRRRRALSISGAIVTSLVLGLFAGSLLPRSGQDTLDGGDGLSDERRDGIREAFDQIGAGGDTQTDDALHELESHWDRLEHEVQAYNEDLEAGEDEHPLLLRRMCIEDRLGRFYELLERLTAMDAASAPYLKDAIAELPPPSTCRSNLIASLRSLPSERDAAAVHEVRRELWAAYGHRAAGQFDEARLQLARLNARAKDLEYQPLIAETLFEAARIELDAGVLDIASGRLREAVTAAFLSGDDQLLLSVVIVMVKAAAIKYENLAEAQVLLSVAEAVWLRNGQPEEVGPQLTFARGAIVRLQDEPAAALAIFEKTLQELQKWPMLEASLRPAVLDHMATMSGAMGDKARVLTLRYSALEAAERHWGPAHVELVLYLGNLGEHLVVNGQLDEGGAMLERAARLLAQDPRIEHHASIDRVLLEIRLGTLAFAKHDFGVARRRYEAAIHMASQIDARGLMLVQRLQAARINLHMIDLAEGKLESARQGFEALRHETMGIDHLNVLAYLAASLVALQQFEHADTVYRELRERASAVDDPAARPLEFDGVVGVANGLLRTELDAAEREIAVARGMFGTLDETTKSHYLPQLDLLTAIVSMRRAGRRADCEVLARSLERSDETAGLLAQVGGAAGLSETEAGCLGL